MCYSNFMRIIILFCIGLFLSSCNNNNSDYFVDRDGRGDRRDLVVAVACFCGADRWGVGCWFVGNAGCHSAVGDE